MRFGPYAPREIETLIPRLTARGVPFDLAFDEQGSKSDLSFSPSNSLALAEFRTKDYTAQYFYFDIEDHVCARDKELVQMMEEHMHRQPSSSELGRAAEEVFRESEQVISLHQSDAHQLRDRVRKLKRLRAWLAALAILAIVIYWVSMFWHSFTQSNP